MRTNSLLTIFIILCLCLSTSVFAQENPLEIFRPFFRFITPNTLFKNFPLHPDLKQTRRAATTFVETARSLEKKTFRSIDKKGTTTRYSTFQSENAHMTCLIGTADLEKLREIVKDEEYLPISLDNSDKGIVNFWFIHNRNHTFSQSEEDDVAFFITTNVARKSLGFTLGINYHEDNPSSLLYPFFQKLPEHSRQMILYASTNSSELAYYLKNFHGIDVVQKEGQLETQYSHKRSNETHVEFYDSNGDNIIDADLEYTTTYLHKFAIYKQLFTSLGLSSWIDLWQSDFVSTKFVARKNANPSGFLSEMMYTMPGQEIYSLSNVAKKRIRLGSRSPISASLVDGRFDPIYVVRIDQLHYSFFNPKPHYRDIEHTKKQLKIDREIKKTRTIKQEL